MKYIDAEKLIAEIERLKERAEHYNEISLTSGEKEYWSGESGSLELLSSLITSLQQEQPEAPNNLIDGDAVRDDFVREIYRILDADPTNDRANAIIDAFDSLPTISYEQSEVDIDDEIDKVIADYSFIKTIDSGRFKTTVLDYAKIARYFYKLGLKARKEN